MADVNMGTSSLGESPSAPAMTAEARKRSREDSTSGPQTSAQRPTRGASESASGSNSRASQTYVDVDSGTVATHAAPASVPFTALSASTPAAACRPTTISQSHGESPPLTRGGGVSIGASHSGSGNTNNKGSSSLAAAAAITYPSNSGNSPAADPRRMRQATLPMFGLPGDAAAIRKELQDRDTQNEELRAKVRALEEELGRRETTMAFVESQLDQTAARLTHFQSVLRKEMIAASRTSRAEARRTLYANHFRLGQVALWPSNGREMWVEGNALRELLPLEAQATRRRDEVEGLRKVAHALLKQLTRQERERGEKEDSAIGPPGSSPGNSSPNSHNNATSGGGSVSANGYCGDTLAEARRELHLRTAELEALNSQLKSFEEQRVALEREKKALLKEARRVSDEDASVFVTVEDIGPDRRYVLLSLLGKGGFSEVWRAFDLIDGQYVACKIHKVDRAWSQQVMENYRRHAQRELEIMRQLDHPNLTRQYNVFQLSDTMFVSVMEHCDGMDLDTHLKRYGTVTEKDAQLVVRQMVCALLYLAQLENPVIHYDLKPANILLSTEDATILGIKITDFGLSKIVGNARDGPSDNPSIDLTSQGSGTYWYLPPECFETAATPRISNKVDVWSLGVIFFQMLFGRRPFAEGQSQRRIWQERLITTEARTLTFPEQPRISEEAKDFLRHCLAFQVTDRYDIFQLSLHPYLGHVARHKAATRSRAPQGTN